MKKSVSEVLYILRFLAANMVLWGHVLVGFQKTVFQSQRYFPYIQNIGVVIFYLLSGFLTMYTYRMRREDSFINHFINRFSRIYVGFIPAIIGVWLIDSINLYLDMGGVKYEYNDGFNFATFILNIIMLAAIKPFGSARTFWTLTDEWWLYMLTGYFYYSIWPQIKEKKRINILSGIMLMCFMVIPCIFILPKYHYMTIVWILGAVSFELYEKMKKNNFLTIFSIILMMICFVRIKDAYNLISILAVAAAFLLIIVWANNYNAERLWLYNFFKGGAERTYSLYLTHYTIVYWICKKSSDMIWGCIGSIVISYIVAILFYYVFESRRTWVYRKCNEIIMEKKDFVQKRYKAHF